MKTKETIAMKTVWTTAAAITMLTAGLVAQTTTPVHPGRGGSPHVKTSWTIDGAAITIEYGRPSLKGRPESELMPAGQPWRAGADEATVITSDKPLRFGALTMPAGSFTINAQPGAAEWQFILGNLSKPGQWGVPYNATLERGRAPMRVTKAGKPVEQFLISIDDTPAGATLKLEWGTAVASIDFVVAQ
jgi:hypothetical protein